MNTHGIPAAPWQLGVAAKELKAIILPLTGGWVSGDPSTWPPIEALESGFEVGDRVYLQEEWAHGFINGMGAVDLPVRCFEQDEILDEEGLQHWLKDDPNCKKLAGVQPAHTMPPEGAQHWFEVTGVRVCKACQLTSSEVWGAGLNITELDAQRYITLQLKWSAAHPGYPWDNNRPVVVLDVEAIDL
jgi:hypothetical protein